MIIKFRNIAVILAVFMFIGIFTMISIISTDKQISQTERRELTKKPTLSKETLLDGKFMSDFEKYNLDQFPFRDNFRTLKAVTSLYVMGKADNNNIYMADGFISKLDYPMDNKSVEHASSRIEYIYNKYLSNSNSNIYLSVIPDKNYFMAEKNGYPTMDYNSMVNTLCDRVKFAKYIDLFPQLKLDDYYHTDTHWRQEKIDKIARLLCDNMDTPFSNDFSIKKLDIPFYGVYYGQYAIPVQADEIYYIYSKSFDSCTAFDFETNKNIPIYDLEKTKETDPYEMYLSGSKSLITIENKTALSNKELIIFRDSFGSSLAPYLINSYKKIYLVDIRYIYPDYLDRFIDFNNKDVLFLYSTLVLNNSVTFK